MINHLLKILDTYKLIGSNCKVWYRNLIIILDSEKIGYVLEKLLPKTFLKKFYPRGKRYLPEMAG